MLRDHEIAAAVKTAPIGDIAARLGILPEDLIPFGDSIAKVNLRALKRPRPRPDAARLILVSATTPTSAGEGKTTISIGLGQALAKLGESVCIALREPSLGPCLGIKGGATGGGYSQVVPADRINLHFTGDFHAITTANNLISASIDNHIYWGNDLRLAQRLIAWRRVMDMNDRSLRKIVLGLGGRYQGIPREGGFDITAASEIMAILCLANDIASIFRCLSSIIRTLEVFDIRHKVIIIPEVHTGTDEQREVIIWPLVGQHRRVCPCCRRQVSSSDSNAAIPCRFIVGTSLCSADTTGAAVLP